MHPGRVMPVEQIAEALWGDSGSARSVHAIRVYVSRLRSLLAEAVPGAPPVVAGSGGYLVDLPRAAVDILRFEDLVSEALTAERSAAGAAVAEQALGLWSAEPFAGFPYDDFAVETRRRLTELRLDASEIWTDAALSDGRSSDVIAYLAPLVREHPLRERLWAALATGLYREQRQTEALRSIESARSALREIGLEVGAQLTRLESSILSHDEALDLRPDPPPNLPSPVDSFVGREATLSDVKRTIESSRLTTLVGPGGCGKTRLAVETARQQLDDYDQRVWIVDLAPLDSAESVPETVVDALAIGPWSDRPPLLAVAEAIGDRRSLMVFDNCEHLIEAAAAFIGDILRRCPELRVLATSREALRIPGESVFNVPSLGLPPESGSPEQLRESGAVTLFLDRTRSARPDFELTDENAGTVAEVVRMLDGIPLAIELAAVRVRTMPLLEMARRLDDLFATLGVGSRTALPRHRTLEAALSWSMDLLNTDERTLFCQLGIFRSEFGLDAATAVSGDRAARRTEQLLAGLVEKSMVGRVPRDEPRYRLLEPLRQYALRKLPEFDDVSDVDARRDAFYSALADEASDGVRRFEDPWWKHRFGRERPDLLTAVESLLRRGKPDAAARMTETIARYWLEFGLYEEGKRLVYSVLNSTPGPGHEARLSLMTSAAWICIHQGDYRIGEGLAVEAIELAARTEDSTAEVTALNALGSLAANRGDMRRSTALLTQARETAGEDHPALYGPITVNLAAVRTWAGDLATGHQLINELGDNQYVSALPHFITSLRGLAARMAGDLAVAHTLLETAVDDFAEHGSAFHTAMFRLELATVALEAGDHAEARRLCRILLGQAKRGSTPLAPKLRARVLRARLMLAEGATETAHANLIDTLDEAASTGTVGVMAEAADVVGLAESLVGSPDRAARILQSGTALRDRIELARDRWEQRQYEAAIARVGGVESADPLFEDPAEIVTMIRQVGSAT